MTAASVAAEVVVPRGSQGYCLKDIYIYIYAYMYNIYIHTFICIYESLSLYVYIYIYIHICMCIYIYIYVLLRGPDSKKQKHNYSETINFSINLETIRRKAKAVSLKSLSAGRQRRPLWREALVGAS